MRAKSPRSLFGIICLSLAVGLILYWVMFMNVLPRLMRPEASTILPIMSGIIGTASCALLYLGISNLIAAVRSKPKAGRTLVLRRGEGGRVVSIGWAEAPYVSKAGVPAKNVAKPVRGLPKAQKHGKAKYVVFIVLATLILGGYASALVLTGYTLQDLMRGMSPFMVISSQSMQPAINYGDLIIVRKEPAERIMVGDIIAFNVPGSYDRMVQSPVIHRVVDKWAENGEVYFKTRGDNNPYEDPWDVPAENVVGKYALRIPYIGLVVLLLKQPPGLVALVGLVTVSLLYSYLRRGKAG